MRLHGVDSAQPGQFVFAGYVYQAFALPASFIAPCLREGKQGHRQGPPLRGGPQAVAGAVPDDPGRCCRCSIAAVRGPRAVQGRLRGRCLGVRLDGPVRPDPGLQSIGRFGIDGRRYFAAANKHAVCRALVLPLAMELCWAAGVSDAACPAACTVLVSRRRGHLRDRHAGLVEVACINAAWSRCVRARVIDWLRRVPGLLPIARGFRAAARGGQPALFRGQRELLAPALCKRR